MTAFVRHAGDNSEVSVRSRLPAFDTQPDRIAVKRIMPVVFALAFWAITGRRCHCNATDPSKTILTTLQALCCGAKV